MLNIHFHLYNYARHIFVSHQINRVSEFFTTSRDCRIYNYFRTLYGHDYRTIQYFVNKFSL
jgi:hypothetical protein